jgi:hypothetical protein
MSTTRQREVRTLAAGVCALAVGAVLAVPLACPTRARACGGCFAPPATETVTVVVGHRMAVSLSATETTLWDQIQYAGDPEDFVWVLPIAGEVLIELADNAFFEALSQATQITLTSPPPPQTFCPDPCGVGGGALDGAPGADGGGGSVTVYGEAIVGPYETVTVGSKDPTALVTWLQDNGYSVPDTILPTIAHYVDQGLNFAVLRLAPNAGVTQMQPVRVTTPGAMPVFPLRMVAAGVTADVSLELYIIAEGRYGAANFEVRAIGTGQLEFDWSTRRFNYEEVFEQTLRTPHRRAWIVEYAQPGARWRDAVLNAVVFDATGARALPHADLEVATRSLSAPYLTKLRTELPVEELGEDLILEAEVGGDISNFISVTNERNRPRAVRCSTSCTDWEPPPRAHSWDCSASGVAVDGTLLPTSALVLLSAVSLRRWRSRRPSSR